MGICGFGCCTAVITSANVQIAIDDQLDDAAAISLLQRKVSMWLVKPSMA